MFRSLIGRSNSLFQQNHFPVMDRREFSCKVLERLNFLAIADTPEPIDLRNSLFFSLLPGNLHWRGVRS